jgi:hypothetical protein
VQVGRDDALAEVVGVAGSPVAVQALAYRYLTKGRPEGGD